MLVLNTKAYDIKEELEAIYKEMDEFLPSIEKLAPKYVKIYKELYEPVAEKKEVVDLDGFKKIYREISKETHPDKISGHEDQFKRASVAYKEKDEVEMARVYEELGHETTIDTKSLEEELKELKASPRYRWVILYKAGSIAQVREEFLKFLLNEIYVMETKNGM